MKPSFKRVLSVIEKNQGYFPEGFLSWAQDNKVIIQEFIAECHRVIDAGFKHYGAHVIVQYIRHYTALEAKDDTPFKISNDVFPYLSRVFALLYPRKDYLFDYHHTRRTRLQFRPHCLRITDPAIVELVMEYRSNNWQINPSESA